MCGFFGEISKNLSEINVTELHNSIRHRGPDDCGSEAGNNWMLGFNRLSIIDLSASGHQPMWDTTHRYIIVFNGEVYNYKELKDSFLQDISLRSTSDTEILLNLLIKKEENALQYLNGMFSFIFIDTQTGNYLAARDRLGVKPFYYYYDKKSFRFASELKALLKWPNAPREINHKAVTEYLFLNYIGGDQTIFNNYYKLKAGHFIKGNFNAPEHIKIASYWNIPERQGNNEKDIAALESEFETIFGNAVDIRLRSDVPVGIFLSGGIDSSLVGAFTSRTALKDQITAFTVAFSEKAYDESSIALETAKHLGIKSQTIRMEASRLSDIDILSKYYDEPFADSSALPSYHLCKAASEHGTVFLTGDGGDESFAGYNRYIRSLRSKSLQQLPSAVKYLFAASSGVLKKYGKNAYKLKKAGSSAAISTAFMDNLPYDPIYDYIYSNEVIAGRQEFVCEKMKAYWSSDPSYPTIAKQQDWDIALYLTDDILVKMDRASMANSIEVRSPFLDYRIVEWAATVPEKYLIDKNYGKKFLRTLCSKYLTGSVINAPKSGFGVPLNDWFSGKEGYDFLMERITSKSFALNEYIDKKNLIKIAGLQYKGLSDRSFGSLFWSLLMFDSWYHNYLN